MYVLVTLRFLTHSFIHTYRMLFYCRKLFVQNHNNEYTVTSVSVTFRWAMLCT
ncbi:hypothetical protein LEQ41_03500 [Streptococcus agalactiae]|nr:hypothetical protein [Streptococcus agalactiae]